jgi:hypothetical protein
VMLAGTPMSSSDIDRMGHRRCLRLNLEKRMTRHAVGLGLPANIASIWFVWWLHRKVFWS